MAVAKEKKKIFPYPPWHCGECDGLLKTLENIATDKQKHACVYAQYTHNTHMTEREGGAETEREDGSARL